MAWSITVTAECANDRCAAVGVPRRVILGLVAEGVIAKPTLLCSSCGHVLKEVPEPDRQ